MSRDVAIVLAEQRLMRNAGMIVREMVKQQIPLADAEDVFRSMYVNAALEVAKGRKTRAAKLLGVHRNTMYRRGA